MSKESTQYYNFNSHKYKVSYAGLNGRNKPIPTFKVKSINKTDCFSQNCTDSLLQLELVEEIPKGENFNV